MAKKRGSQTTGDGRPQEVLEALKKTPEARKEFFKNFWVAHRRIQEVAEELLRLILDPGDSEVIYLIGATGVGKTTLIKYVIAKLYEIALPTIDRFPGRIPAAYMEAESPDKGAYDWGKHYINVLVALNEILIDKKVYLPEPSARRGETKFHLKGEPRGRTALRHAAENALDMRIIYTFFVDEGQYLIKRKSGEGLMDQADTFRSLASRSKTLHVIGGTYDLRFLRNLNGQLGRRSHTVHFRRYKTDGLTVEEQVEEVKAFTQAFMSFQAYLPVDEEPDLARHIEFCFTRCLGCIGHLKNWFLRSLNAALDTGSKTVSPRMFLKAAPKKDVWERIAQEIADGEPELEMKDEELEAELNKLAAADTRPSARSEEKERSVKGGQGKTARKKKQTTPKGKKSGRPFMPKPERYPVGLEGTAE
jgi:hypothetical protein